MIRVRCRLVVDGVPAVARRGATPCLSQDVKKRPGRLRQAEPSEDHVRMSEVGVLATIQPRSSDLTPEPRRRSAGRR